MVLLLADDAEWAPSIHWNQALQDFGAPNAIKTPAIPTVYMLTVRHPGFAGAFRAGALCASDVATSTSAGSHDAHFLPTQ